MLAVSQQTFHVLKAEMFVHVQVQIAAFMQQQTCNVNGQFLEVGYSMQCQQPVPTSRDTVCNVNSQFPQVGIQCSVNSHFPHVGMQRTAQGCIVQSAAEFVAGGGET